MYLVSIASEIKTLIYCSMNGVESEAYSIGPNLELGILPHTQKAMGSIRVGTSSSFLLLLPLSSLSVSLLYSLYFSPSHYLYKRLSFTFSLSNNANVLWWLLLNI